MADRPEMPWQFRIFTGERPPTVNQVNRMRRGPNPGQATAELNSWAKATHDGLIDAGLTRIRIVRYRLELHPVYPKAPVPDGDGLDAVAKVIQDAVVTAEIVPDDNPHHAERPLVHPARIKPELDWVILVADLVPLEPVEGHQGECGCRAAHEAQAEAAARGGANGAR